jgi:hypothetical protein
MLTAELGGELEAAGYRQSPQPTVLPLESPARDDAQETDLFDVEVMQESAAYDTTEIDDQPVDAETSVACSIDDAQDARWRDALMRSTTLDSPCMLTAEVGSDVEASAPCSESPHSSTDHYSFPNAVEPELNGIQEEAVYDIEICEESERSDDFEVQQLGDAETSAAHSSQDARRTSSIEQTQWMGRFRSGSVALLVGAEHAEEGARAVLQTTDARNGSPLDRHDPGALHDDEFDLSTSSLGPSPERGTTADDAGTSTGDLGHTSGEPEVNVLGLSQAALAAHNSISTGTQQNEHRGTAAPQENIMHWMQRSEEELSNDEELAL